MSDNINLWAAVDRITQPTEQRIERSQEADWLADLTERGYATHNNAGFCRVEEHRAALTRHGRIPPLWDQATWAIRTGTESAGGGGGSPLRERSPADLDLMETVLTIRESMAWQLKGRGVVPRDGIKAQMRQLASHIIAKEPQHIEWWTYRFEQWARLLANYLDALDTGPKPVYLRGSACPLCKTRQVTVDRDGEPRVVPALVIDFHQGWIRAATCQACTASWFRGDDLGALADALDTTTQDGMMSA